MLFKITSKIKFIICTILLSGNLLTFAQNISAFQEYEPKNPTPLRHLEVENWKYVTPGLNGSVASIDIRYDRDLVPQVKKQNTCKFTVWKGEKVNLQFVLWTKTAVSQIRIVPAFLVNEAGKKIERDNIITNFVRYVLSDNSFYGCDINTQRTPPVLVADILDTVPMMDMQENNTRPVWITINVPPETEPGNYKGKILVKAQGNNNLIFNIELTVLPLILDPPEKWQFELDLWHNPWAVARYHDIKPWSNEHILLLKPLLEKLGDAGQKYITTSIIHHPWNAQTYDPYDSMVEWIKNKDGSWSYDYTVFDKYVDLCMSCGISKYISCYSMICFRNNQYRYFNTETKDYQYLSAEPGTKEFEQHWTPFLKDFVNHLKQKGWLEKTLIAMDERPYELMKEIINLVHSVSPDLKIALALEDWNEKLSPEIFSFSVSLGRYTHPDFIQQRKKMGFVSTFYPCCVEPKPNTYPHSPPAESAWMGWMVAADGFSGFLRWAYNSWVENPLYDTRYVQWNSGESFLVYPGPRSSIRFERLREGIQDYEKIRIVKNKLLEMNTDNALEKLKKLNIELEKYSYKNAQNVQCEEMVNSSKQLLNDISIWISQ